MEIEESPTTDVDLLLDPSGEAFLPRGFVEIRHEVAFLNAVVGGRLAPSTTEEKTRFLIRGASLCRWVRTWALGHGLRVGEVASPLALLSRIVPEMPDAFLNDLRTRLGDRIHQFRSDSCVNDVLQQLYPDGPWEKTVSERHATRYLLFLAESTVPPCVSFLLKVQTSLWQQEEQSLVERVAYSITDSVTATHHLRQWLLGWQDDTLVSPLRGKTFALTVPEYWQNEAKSQWRIAATQKGGASFWKQLRKTSIPPVLLSIAASIAAQSLLQNPAELTLSLFQDLSAFISDEWLTRLRKACPPQKPSVLLETMSAPDVLCWFEKEYLPFRQWQVLYGQEHDAKIIEQCNQSFSRWCLQYYPVALSGGNGREHLAISRSQSLYTRRQETDKTATLWVFLEGLPYPDGITLQQRLLALEPRLCVIETVPVVAPLPTITRFAKPSVMNGIAPNIAVQGSSASEASTPRPSQPGCIVSGERDCKNHAETLCPGDVLVFSLLEPDKTYHVPQNAETIRINVDSQLTNIATKIAGILQEIPEELSLRVCITTDHGRMLSSGIPRELAVPEGMVAESRAAWCDPYQCDDHGFSSGGYRLEGSGTIRLSGLRFGLPTDVVVCEAQAFRRADGASGDLAFPHGGLSAEEVLIPWIELERDRSLPVIQGRCEGHGTSQNSGTITITLENVGITSANIARLFLQNSRSKIRLGVIELNEGLSPLERRTMTRLLDVWPTLEECQGLIALVEIVLPDGQTLDIPIDCYLTARSLYTQSLSATDLEGF